MTERLAAGCPAGRLLASMALLAFAGTAEVARAQDGPPEAGPVVRTPPIGDKPDGGLDIVTSLGDIIVTAQRRSESVQRVPIAITAITGDTLRAQGIQGVNELAQTVPNLHIKTQWGRSNPQFYMRGVGVSNFDETVPQSVGVYLDENYMGGGAAQLAQFFDVERVEVLRGPQGTLFGRNTTGGAIGIYTKRPGDRFEGYIDASYGNYGAYKVEGGITLPIGEGLSSRVSFFTDQRDGWFENLYEGTTDGLRTGYPDSKYNDVHYYALRGTLAYDVDDFEAVLSVYGSKDRSRPTNGKQFGLFVDPVTGIRHDAYFAVTGYVEPQSYKKGFTDVENKNFVTVYGTTLRMVAALGAVDLTSVTGYLYTDRYVHSDCDKSSTKICDFNRFGTTNQYSQELRLASAGDGPLRYVLGAYAFKESLTQGSYADIFSDPIFNQRPSLFPDIGRFYHLANYEQNSTNFAAFAQFDYKVSGDVTLTAGARYSWERKRFLTHTRLNLPPYNGTNVVDFIPPTPDSKSWGSPSWRFAVNWQAGPAAIVYGSYSRGFKSGGFPANNLTQFAELSAPFNPETVDSFELGTKLDLIDRRLRVNLAGFYNRYRDMQVFTFRTIPGIVLPQTLTDNAANSRIFGVELEATAYPVPKLAISANLAYLNAKYEDYQQGAVSYARNTLINAPQWSGDVSATYTAVLPNQATLAIRGNVNFSSRRFFTQANLLDLSQGSYALAEFDLTYTAASGIALQAWIKNAFDKAIIVESTDTSGLGGYYERFYGTPRTFGVTLHIPID